MAGLGDMAKIKNISTRGDISPSEEKYLKLQKEKNCFGICSISPSEEKYLKLEKEKNCFGICSSR